MKRPRLGTSRNPIYTVSQGREQWPKVLTSPRTANFNVNAPSIDPNWINDRLGNTEPFYPDYHNGALCHLDKVLKANNQSSFLIEEYLKSKRQGGII